MKDFYTNLRGVDVFTEAGVDDAVADSTAEIISDTLPEIGEAATDAVIGADVAVLGTMASDASTSLLTLILLALICWIELNSICLTNTYKNSLLSLVNLFNFVLFSLHSLINLKVIFIQRSFYILL